MSFLNVPTITPPPNPNPARFQILRAEAFGTTVIACILYPDCTTYEGRKVLMFANTTIDELRHCRLIDPHFSDVAMAGTLVPVARFEPTERGWRLARIAAVAL